MNELEQQLEIVKSFKRLKMVAEQLHKDLTTTTDVRVRKSLEAVAVKIQPLIRDVVILTDEIWETLIGIICTTRRVKAKGIPNLENMTIVDSLANIGAVKIPTGPDISEASLNQYADDCCRCLGIPPVKDMTERCRPDRNISKDRTPGYANEFCHLSDIAEKISQEA